MKIISPVAFSLTLFLGILPSVAFALDPNSMDTCILELFRSGGDKMTVGEVRSQCREIRETSQSISFRQSEAEKQTKDVVKSSPVVEERLKADKNNVLKPFTLMSHKPNYVLIGTSNSEGYSSEFHEQMIGGKDIDFDDSEVQFQISVKTPLAIGMFNRNVDIYAAYTNRSFWQVYNEDISSPFRETNHEPEAWLQFRPDWSVFGCKNTVNQVGIVHQSNGMASVVSRSWNRIFAIVIFERNDFAFIMKPWYRIPENADKDDNPDITDFLGHAEFGFAYKWKENAFSLMLRNNLESGFERGAVGASWSFPLLDYKYLKGYIQYFNGYGESLLDYNRKVNTIGFGVLLTDWL